MKIVLLKDWTAEDGTLYKATSILDVDEITEKELIENETAKYFRSVTPVTNEPEGDSMEVIIEKAVEKAVGLVIPEGARIEVGAPELSKDISPEHANRGCGVNFQGAEESSRIDIEVPDGLKLFRGPANIDVFNLFPAIFDGGLGKDQRRNTAYFVASSAHGLYVIHIHGNAAKHPPLHAGRHARNDEHHVRAEAA